MRNILAGCLADGIGKFGRMGGGQREHGLIRAQELAPHVHPHGAMRIQKVSVLSVKLADCRQGVGRCAGSGRDKRVHAGTGYSVQAQFAGVRERLHQSADFPGIATHQIIQIALKITRHLDIHGRAQRGLYRPTPVHTGIKKPGQNVVFVRCQNQPADRQPHARGQISRKNVAEITRRHHDPDRAPAGSRHDAEGTIKIVYDLGQQARPVDGIRRTQFIVITERQVLENSSHDSLTVIETAAHGQAKDIVVRHSGHLALLGRTDPSMRIKHKNAQPKAPPDTGNGRTAGIATGGRQDIQSSARLCQIIFEHATKELQGHILERQCRSMK